MSTLYSQIDNMFLSDIKDSTFLDFFEEERLIILNDLRIKAITRFKACQKDLTDRTEATDATELLPATEGQFNETLTEEEMLILATIMRKYWLNDKLYNLELIQQRMTPKDWKMTSQAEHLNRLTVLKKDLEAEISRMIVDYTVYSCSLE